MFDKSLYLNNIMISAEIWLKSLNSEFVKNLRSKPPCKDLQRLFNRYNFIKFSITGDKIIFNELIIH